MAEVHGTADAKLAGIRDVLAERLEADELGASIVVDVDGEQRRGPPGHRVGHIRH